MENVRISLRSVARLLVVLMVACSSYRPGPQYRPDNNLPYRVQVVEVDDQGRFFDRSEEQRAVDAVHAAAKRGGAIIAVFIHGWHHNAGSGDSNLTDFAKVLSDLKLAVDEEVYRGARKVIFGHEDADVVGIYVGWRGESLPGVLDYLTFWDRKPAAQRVGEGDVVELLTRLDQICRDANNQGAFTTLVTIGHSFGAQVVTSAMETNLRNRVVTASDGAGFPRPIVGFGDLIVLVNPAAESALLQPISSMTRKARFSEEQTPVVLTVSSENDYATGKWFPLGRRIGLAGQIFHDGEYEENIRALGWNANQITHCMAIDGGSKCHGYADRQVRHRGPSFSAAEARSGASAASYAGVWKKEDVADARHIELGGDMGWSGVKLYRIADDIDPNQPFVFAKATSEVVNGHNGMFTKPFVEFLIRYVAGVELKRLAMRATQH
jgi:hypothetical protein